MGINNFKEINKPKKKDNKKDNLKKHKIEMTHQPFCGKIIPVTNFIHCIFKRHREYDTKKIKKYKCS